MDNGRCFGVTLTPGKHVCRMGDKQTGFEIDIKEGQSFYAWVSIATWAFGRSWTPDSHTTEHGGFEIKNKRHFIGIATETADGKKNGYNLQAKNDQYRALITALEGVTGLKVEEELEQKEKEQ